MENQDDYDHIEPKIEYIPENILFEPEKFEESNENKEFKMLKSTYNSILQNSCECTEDSSCDINVSTKICKHSGNYYKNSQSSELLLNPNRKSKDLIYECTEMCGCGENCINRLVQFGPNKNLEIIVSNKLPDKQYGLQSKKTILKGAFICEYVGEILTKTEVQQRLTKLNENKKNYIICLNEYPLNKTSFEMDPLQTFIDPEFKGNIGRYINHSCDPNCEILSVRTDSFIPKLGIFAKRDILPHEEITFHYGVDVQNNQIKLQKNNGIKCYCGSKNCQMFLPNLEF